MAAPNRGASASLGGIQESPPKEVASKLSHKMYTGVGSGWQSGGVGRRNPGQRNQYEQRSRGGGEDNGVVG